LLAATASIVPGTVGWIAGCSGRRGARLGAVFATLLGLGASRAGAADPAEVEALIGQGNDLRREGKEHQAFALFHKAHDLSPTPRTAAQLALVEMQLSYWLDAEKHLSEALAAPHDLWVDRNRQALETALQQVKASIGLLEVAGSPPGAQVKVNGRAVGRLPLPEPIRLAEGPAVVEVSAPGFSSWTQSVNVAGEARKQLTVELRPPRPQGPAISPGPTPAAHRWRSGAWISAGGAAAALVAGVLGNLWWRHSRVAFDEHSLLVSSAGATIRRFDCGEDEVGRGGPECQRIYRQLDRGRTVALAGYGLAGLLAATSLTLFLVRPGGEEQRPRLACAGWGTLPGASCRVPF
jgi:hypothetical protein